MKAWLAFLACPKCGADLDLESDRLVCSRDGAAYPIRHGIPDFTQGNSEQDVEIQLRDLVSVRQDPGTAVAEVSRHHFVPRLRRRVRHLESAAAGRPILDLGSGWAWPWLEHRTAAPIVCVDFSFPSLVLAKRLLTEAGVTGVFLICADATNLPIKNEVFYAVWSVQMLQHLSPPLLDKALAEVARVLVAGGHLEARWLNYGPPFWLSSYLRGIKPQKEMETDHYYIHRVSTVDLRRILARNFPESSVAYDELIFHPSLKLAPKSTAASYIDSMLSRLPGVRALLANQLVGLAKKGERA